MIRFFSKPWRVATALWLVGAVSILFALMHMFGIFITGNTPEEPHYTSMPIPIVIHLVTGTLLNLFIPLQFEARFRNKFNRTHRTLGFIIASCVVTTFATTLWMNHYYPPYGGTAKYWGIIAHNCVLLGGCSWAVLSIIRGRLLEHRLGMVCMAAAALSPATQRIVIIPIYIAVGHVSDLAIGALIWFGLLCNLSIGLWFFTQTTKYRLFKSNTTGIQEATTSPAQ